MELLEFPSIQKKQLKKRLKRNRKCLYQQLPNQKRKNGRNKCAKYNLLNFKKVRTKKWGKNFRLAQRTKDFISKCMDSLEPTLLRWLNLGHFRKMTKFSDKPIKWKSIYAWTIKWKVFPDSSVGKEPICNAGDPGSIPGLGRSTGEGIGYPLQYSWASLWLSW